MEHANNVKYIIHSILNINIYNVNNIPQAKKMRKNAELRIENICAIFFYLLFN